jgi:hypothetical protein
MLFFKKQNDSKSWLQGLIHGETILTNFMNKHDQKPSSTDMKAKLKGIWFNHCNSFSQQATFDAGVIDYIETYINAEYKELLNTMEVYIP